MTRRTGSLRSGERASIPSRRLWMETLRDELRSTEVVRVDCAELALTRVRNASAKLMVTKGDSTSTRTGATPSWIMRPERPHAREREPVSPVTFETPASSQKDPRLRRRVLVPFPTCGRNLIAGPALMRFRSDGLPADTHAFRSFGHCS